MEWLPILTNLGIFALVFIPIIWLMRHFKGSIPDSGLRNPNWNKQPKTELEKIFGM